MKDRALAQSLGLISQLGFSIACPMLGFIAGGAWLDGQLGTVPWLLLVGVLLGIVAAGGALYRIATLPTSHRKAQESKYKVTATDVGEGTLRADRRAADEGDRPPVGRGEGA